MAMRCIDRDELEAEADRPVGSTGLLLLLLLQLLPLLLLLIRLLEYLVYISCTRGIGFSA